MGIGVVNYADIVWKLFVAIHCPQGSQVSNESQTTIVLPDVWQIV